ncbi:MAG: DNA-protecting protein DprA [Clostridia bacterium]|nr:DNA-protecting protein DprA [Clostridia bacterium]
MRSDDLAALVDLHRLPGMGAVRLRRAIATFGGPAEAWRAGPAAVAAAVGLGPTQTEALVTAWRRAEPGRALDRALAAGFHCLTPDDFRYPSALADLPDAPPLLFARGELRAEDRRALTIVGTRYPDDLGLWGARRFAAATAAAGVTVVSGMARGVDAAAHESTLAEGGRTLAVLGCGLDVVYPPEHQLLYRRIAAQGAVLSQFPLGTPPHRHHFPIRNRLLAALGAATLVVESGARGGALITARWAAELGRDVFVLPADPRNARAAGNLRLLADGAFLALDPAELLEMCGWSPPGGIGWSSLERRLRSVGVEPLPAGVEPPLAGATTPPGWGEEVVRVWRVLDGLPRTPGQVAALAGLDVGRTAAALVLLALAGAVERYAGDRYARKA